MNAAARLVFASSNCDHITPLLRTLAESSMAGYKLAVLVYKCLHGLAPSYLADELLHPAESEFRRRLRSASSHEQLNCLFPVPDSQPTATELFQSPLYGSGTVFRSISHLPVTSCLLLSLDDIGPTSSNCVIRNYCCRAREVTLSWTR